MKRIFLFLVIFSIPKSSYAWMPCMPFCDSACGAAAIQAMSASIVSALQSQTSANQQLLQAINDTTQSTVNMGVDLSDAWTSSTMDILSALDARTARIELATAMGTKSRQQLTDAFNTTFTQALRQSFIAESVNENIRAFSNISMPETGELGVYSANAIKEVYFKSKQLVDEISNNQLTYSSELSGGDLGYAKSLKSTNDIGSPSLTPFLCEKTISDDELNSIQVLLTYVTNASPLPVLSGSQGMSTAARKYELERRLYNVKTQFVSSVVNQIISAKAQLTSGDFVRSYVSRTTQHAKVSASETFDSIVRGRVTAEGWYQNIKLLSNEGLDRELAYLKAEENALLFSLLQRREWRNQLLALIAVEGISKQSRRLVKL